MSVEGLIRRDRAITGAGLAALAALAWLYLFLMASRMGGAEMAGMTMPMPADDAWDARHGALTFVMWAVMMIAMMLPAASPMILTFATINRRRSGTPPVPTAVFLAGYLVIWSAFSALATAGQWALQAAALLAPGSLKASPLVGGALLVAAGAYQLTPLKYACLARCQSPLGFILTEWREGASGAFIMGVRHGAFCVGCCWALMALLFVAGVMNLLWVATIAALVLVEKLLPRGRAVSWGAGALLLAWGAWVLAQALRV